VYAASQWAPHATAVATSCPTGSHSLRSATQRFPLTYRCGDGTHRPDENAPSFGHLLWVTKYSDIEAYWATPGVIESHFGISAQDAQDLLDEAVAAANVGDSAIIKMRAKRSDALNKINDNGSLPHFGDAEVIAQSTIDGTQFAVLGKQMVRESAMRLRPASWPEAAASGAGCPPN